MNKENLTKESTKENLTKEKFKEIHNALHSMLIQLYVSKGFDTFKETLMEPIIESKDKGMQERICMCWYSFEVLVSAKLSQVIKPEDKIKYNALVAVVLDKIKEIVQEKY